MTKYIERNWAKWEANLAPILAAAEKQDKSVRRMTIKMCEDDPAEETKQPFSQASDLTMAEQMFQKIGIPQHNSSQAPQQQAAVAQAPPATPSFYE
jgi:nicotinamide mononucleotide adenylyltransferase